MSLGLDRLDRKTHPDQPGSWRILNLLVDLVGHPIAPRSFRHSPPICGGKWWTSKRPLAAHPIEARDAVEVKGFSGFFMVFPTKKVHIFVEDGGYGGTASVVSPRFLAL